MSSLPVPLSPVISNVDSASANCGSIDNNRPISGLRVMMSLNPTSPASSLRNSVT